MDSPVKIMANNVYDRISKEAEAKQFRCKNAEEWYFTCSIFFEYVVVRTNYSKKLIAGKRCELTRLATQKKEDLVRQKMLNLFQKEYTNGIDEKYQTDLVDGVFLAIVSYGFEENEKYFDGSAAFNYGGRQVLTNGGKQKNRIMEIVKAIRMKSGCFFDTRK